MAAGRFLGAMPYPIGRRRFTIAEELYEWTLDRWQVRNLAADPAHRQTLESLRARLDRWIVETNDHGPESVGFSRHGTTSRVD